MSFLWNDESIRWFLDASAYTDFHHKLSRLILPYLSPDYTVCDIGCGLGRLDLEIAPYVSKIHALDVDSRVIAELLRDAALLGFGNIDARQADADELDEAFDVLLMSFFGKQGDDSNRYYKLCKHKLIRIVGSDKSSRLHPKGKAKEAHKDTIKTLHEELERQKRRYELIVDTFEFGQPLRSWAEAEKFASHYSFDADYEAVRFFLHENIILTGRDDFALYLPNPREVGIFIIDGEG